MTMRFSPPRSPLIATLLLVVVASFMDVPSAHARLKKFRKRKAASAPAVASPLVFRSRGTVVGGGQTRQRDRTITMVRAGNQVELVIDDHVDAKVTKGTVAVTPERQLVTEDPALINAANIVGVTPGVLRELRSGKETVETTGQVEANGKVYPVVMVHQLGDWVGKESTEVITTTESENGKLALETRARLDANGIPVSATTQGRLKVFVFSATINLTLERVSGSGL